jgi:CHAT domain-containing protein/Tfp pilus assembly protein PilF
MVYLVSGPAGRYRVDVRPIGESQRVGRYLITLVQPQPATAAELHLFDSAQELLRLVREYSGLLSAQKYDEAIPLINQSITLRETPLRQGPPEIAASYNELGAAHYYKGDYEGAIQAWGKALELYKKWQGLWNSDTAMILGQLALVRMEKGEYGVAEQDYKLVLRILQRTRGRRDSYVAVNLNNLGGLYYTLGNYPEAEKYYKGALDIAEHSSGPEGEDTAQYLNNLGLLYYETSDYKRAQPLYERALAIRRKILKPGHTDIAQSLFNLGSLFGALKRYDQAEPLLKESLAIREGAFGEVHPDIAWSLSNLGFLYEVQEKFSEAEPLLRRAAEIRRRTLGPQHPYYAYSLAAYGDLLREQGKYKEAMEELKTALAIQEKALDPYHPDIVRTLNSIANIHEAQNELTDAVAVRERIERSQEYNLKLNLAVGSEQQKLNYLSRAARDMDHAVSLHMRKMHSDARAARLALSSVLRRKGRALDTMADIVANLRRRLTPRTRVLFNRLVDAQARLSTLFLKSSQSGDFRVYREEASRLELEIEDAEGVLSRSSVELRAQTEPVTIEGVKTLIPDGAALVEMVLYQPFNPKAKDKDAFGQDRYAAYVMRHDGTLRWTDLGEASDVDRDILAFRAALRNPSSDRVLPLGRALDEKVMRPIRAMLGGDSTVLISPDGALNLIPFAALSDERGEYLVKSYTFIYLTSGRDLIRLKAKTPSRQTPLIIADPLFGPPETNNRPSKAVSATGRGRRARDFDEHFGPLPGTRGEALALKPLLPQARVLLQEAATEGALKRVRGPKLLHIATHGFFLPYTKSTAGNDSTSSTLTDAVIENQLLFSGLAFAGANERRGGAREDGILTALEASGLNLLGTKLVVLSACETGVGNIQNGEGVYGMRRAFLLAGAESQIMSLWKVDDDVTKELMRNYYLRLRAGEGRAEALREVQKQQLGNLENNHPYFWAAFISSGDWRSLESN